MTAPTETVTHDNLDGMDSASEVIMLAQHMSREQLKAYNDIEKASMNRAVFFGLFVACCVFGTTIWQLHASIGTIPAAFFGMIVGFITWLFGSMTIFHVFLRPIELIAPIGSYEEALRLQKLWDAQREYYRSTGGM